MCCVCLLCTLSKPVESSNILHWYLALGFCLLHSTIHILNHVTHVCSYITEFPTETAPCCSLIRLCQWLSGTESTSYHNSCSLEGTPNSSGVTVTGGSLQVLLRPICAISLMYIICLFWLDTLVMIILFVNIMFLGGLSLGFLFAKEISWIGKWWYKILVTV